MFKFFWLLLVLYRYRTKDSFFRYLRRHTEFTFKDRRLIRNTYGLMEYVFRDVSRESGEPYMTHLHAVLVIIVIYLKSRDMNEILAALLHDVIEHFGQYWTYNQLVYEYNPILARYVLHLTKISAVFFNSEEHCDTLYHASFQRAELPVIRVKIADRIHNVLTLRFCSVAKQLRKIAETIEFYLKWAKEQGILYSELRYSIRLARIFAFFTRA
jgi:GTP pyrophosphokinase